MVIISLIALITLILCATLEITIRSLQLNETIKSYAKRDNRLSQDLHSASADAGEFFVSVHIAAYNEPSALLMSTMRAVGDSQFESFEVIVVDNNTDDPALWLPVADAAKAMGERFKFVHIDRLPGAKAGALNIALARSDPRTTHVAIVDADYQVDSRFLIDGVALLVASGADYVQFPQAYRAVGAAQGIEHELGDYFACFSSGNERPGSMLPTGTLSLFEVSALRAVGGWPTDTITEDAEIGVRLQAAGFRGLWSTQERGRGLLPVDFRGLRKQRARWAAGNLQVLKSLYRRRWQALRLGQFVNLVVQLTAWLTLWLPSAGALALIGLAPHLPLARVIAAIAAGTIVGSATLTAVRIVIASKSPSVPWRVRLGALATKLALTWVSAAAWIPALGIRPLRFHRTLKTIDPSGRGGEPILAAVSFVFLSLGVLYASRGQGLEAAACALLASAWLCARMVDARLRRAARLNPELG